MLLRIADISTEQARQIVGITKGTLNTWCQNAEFVSIQRRRDELNAECKQQAIQILRRDNQLEAVFLEGKIIAKLKEEIESGDYNLMRTHLAREVYSKLIADLDATPAVKVLSWQERITQITNIPPGEVLGQIQEGATVDGQFQEVIQPTVQLQEGQVQANTESPDNETEEETQDQEVEDG